MSWQATGWAWGQEVANPGAKLVLLALANYAAADGSSFPGQKRLAEMTHQSVRSVQRQLDQLEAAGLLSRQHRYPAKSGREGRTSDVYVLALGGPPAQDLPDNLTPNSDASYTTPVTEIHDTAVAYRACTYQSEEPSDQLPGPTVLPATPAAADPPTVNQRSKRLTDAYATLEPMCRWPAINAIVIKAIKSGRYDDDLIGSALQRLASEGRGVTVETLRTELDGLPPARAPNRPSTTDQRVAAGLALAGRYREEETRVEEPGERTAVAGRRV